MYRHLKRQRRDRKKFRRQKTEKRGDKETEMKNRLITLTTERTLIYFKKHREERERLSYPVLRSVSIQLRLCLEKKKT